MIRVIGKGEKERLVPMGEEALYWVERYINNSRPNLLKDNKVSELFLSKRGSSMTRQTFWYRIKEYAAKASIKEDHRIPNTREARIHRKHIIQGINEYKMDQYFVERLEMRRKLREFLESMERED